MERAAVEAGRLTERLRHVLETHIAAQNRADARAAMRHVHTQSPIYDSARRALEQLFLNFELNCGLVRLSFVGADERYAYVRARQRTVKTQGPEFQDNVSELLVVLREEEGVWKIWNQALLGIEFTNAEGTDGGG